MNAAIDEKNRSLLNAVNAFEENAYGSDSDGDLADERAFNVKQYLGKNLSPAPEGRSQVVDRSTYETVSWVMPSFHRIFNSGDDIAEFPPIGPEDEEGAKQEAQFINHIILQKNNWTEIFDTGAKDALITKAGYLHPYVRKRRQVEIEKYENQTAESLALIMQDQPEVVSLSERPDTDAQPTPVMDQMTGQPVIGPDGQPVMQPPPMLYDVEIRRTKEEKHYCIDVFPPERCKIAESTKSVQVADDCSYFEFYDFPTISELRQDGLEIEDDVSDAETDDTPETTARDQFNEQWQADDNKVDPSMRRVKCRWVWVRYDYDGDGIAELQYVIIVGQEILHREEVNRIPIAVLCTDPLPHRHVGTCPADIVGDIQQIKTAVIRQGLDNLYLSNNPMKYADGKFVNLDDMLISRPGGTVRLKPGAMFGQNFGVMPIPFVFPQAIEGLGYMDHVREMRTGVNNSFQGLDAGQLTQLQPGTVNQISSMAAQRTEQAARHLSSGIVTLVSLLHELVLKSGHKKEVVQLRGQWVTVDPSTWRKRTDFRISVGFAAGNKDAQITRLMMIGNMQKEAMMGGLPIVTPENIYETMNELIKASDLQAPQRFLTHPSKAPPKGPPQPDVTVMAMEQIKSQTQLETTRMDVEQKERDSQRDFEIKRLEIETDAQVALNTHREKIQLEKDKTEFGAQKDERMAHLSAQLNPKTKEAEAKTSEVKQKDTLIQQFMESQAKQTQAIGEMFQQMLDSLARMNGPKQIVRGKDGRASHVVPVE